MPELPDLHVFSKNLTKRLAGRRVRNITIWTTKRCNFSQDEISEALAGSSLSEVRREGKETHFHFDNGRILAAHLMLTGEFSITSNNAAIQYPQITIEFEGNEWLVISDQNGWATFTLDPKPSTVPDALSPECDENYLRENLRRHPRVKMKGFLVDQNILRGIGNAYADEILWASKIAPQSLCGKVPEEKVKDLHAAIRSVLPDAIAQIERISPDIITGEIRSFLKIHHTNRKSCPNGHPIQFKMIASKKTYFCEEQVAYV